MNTFNILSGILFGLMYGKNKLKNKKSFIYGISDVIEVKSSMPGRVRFYVPSIKYNDVDKENIAAIFKNIESIGETLINTTTASILITFDKKQINEEILMGVIIKILGLDKVIEEKKEPRVLKEINKLKEALDYSVYKETNGMLNFTSAVPLFLVLLGVKNLIMQKDNQSVNPYTMLYWAYKSIF